MVKKTCSYKGCGFERNYYIGWCEDFGPGEDSRRIVEGAYSCSDLNHLLELSNKRDVFEFWWYPEEIRDVSTGEIKENLLSLIRTYLRWGDDDALEIKLKEELNQDNQLNLFE